MKFIKNTPLTWVAAATFLVSRVLIILFWQRWISDVEYFFQIAGQAWRDGKMAYQDFLWSYPPLSLSIIYLPWAFAKTLDPYRLVFQLFTFAYECILVWYLAKFMVERLKLSAKQTTVGIVCYSLLAMFQGHLIYDRLDLLIVLCFVVALYHLLDPKVYKSMGMGVLGLLWKVMPIFWMPVLGLFKAYQQGKNGLIKSILIATIPSAIVLIGWDTYCNGHMFAMLDMHNERGIQIESTWASVFMVEKVLNPAAAIEIVNNYGAQHLAGADVPEWVVSISRLFGFLCLAVFYWHFTLRLYKIYRSRRAKSFDLYIGAMFAMSAPYIIFLATQRVLSTQYFMWWLPTLAILYAWRPRWPDFVLGTLIMMFTSFEFDGMYRYGIHSYYWDYVKFDPLMTWIMAARNLLLVVFAIRFVMLYKDYYSDEPKYFK